MKRNYQMFLLTLFFVYPMVLWGQGEERNMRPTASQLVINGAEADFNTVPARILISGQNFGDTEPFAGTATLFDPTPPGEVTLFLLDFDPIAQQLLYELPVDIDSTPGTYLLTVSTGDAITQFDAFTVANRGGRPARSSGRAGRDRAGRATGTNRANRRNWGNRTSRAGRTSRDSGAWGEPAPGGNPALVRGERDSGFRRGQLPVWHGL